VAMSKMTDAKARLGGKRMEGASWDVRTSLTTI
jgi:hypothetical protein